MIFIHIPVCFMIYLLSLYLFKPTFQPANKISLIIRIFYLQIFFSLRSDYFIQIKEKGIFLQYFFR